MAFEKYPSIPNQVKGIQRYLDHTYGTIWVATHKYHGVNCQIHWSSEKGIRLGRRNGHLGKNENFYGLKEIAKELDDPLRTLFALFPSASNIRVYGEVYGGQYGTLKTSHRVKAVQKGIWYSPTHRFVGFDVKVDDEFLSYYDARFLCEKVGIPFIKEHMKGSFEDVYKWAQKHCADSVAQTCVDLMKEGLEPLENNHIEGWVIRSCKDHVQLKVKNPTFSEINTVQMKQPQIHGYEDEINKYVTRTRAINVCSHESPDYLSTRNIKALGIKLKDDVLEECDSESILHETKALKFLTGACCKIMRLHLTSM